jgi:uncharacterized coiled-coil protein SlyX
MPNAIQTLQALLERDRKEIEELTAELAAKNRQLTERRARFDALTEAIKALASDHKEREHKDEQTPFFVPKYHKMPLTEAVLDIIEKHGAAPGLFVKEIMDFLAKGAYSSESPNVYASVYSTAMRWVIKGKVTEGTRDGKRSFIRGTPF